MYNLFEGKLPKKLSENELKTILKEKNLPNATILDAVNYHKELDLLQTEMVYLQNWIVEQKKRVVILFEGRDTAGKGGSIKRFYQHLNPRHAKIVALTKPTNKEKGQWYFRRYIKELPNQAEIALFDRSWYNRAVVEPVMGFCTPNEYSTFMNQVTEFEEMLYEDGIHLIKLWLSISKDEQQRRFDERAKNLVKQWKISPVDKLAQEKWDDYTFYSNKMFSLTHTLINPWTIVSTDDKKSARLEAMRHVLNRFEYTHKGSTGVDLNIDPNVVSRYNRNTLNK